VRFLGVSFLFDVLTGVQYVGNKQMRQGTGGGPSVRSFIPREVGPSGPTEEPRVPPHVLNQIVGCNVNACRLLKFSLILYIGWRRRAVSADGRVVDALAPMRCSNQDLWRKRTDQL
jgi:hypothetical protein